MKSAFVIVNYNDSKTTLELINNIKNYKIIDKIVIVDNASTDNSLEVLKKEENDLIVILKNTSNKGYGSGINYGAKYLKTIYSDCNIIISNPDIIIEKEEDLEIMINNMKNDVSVLSPIIKEKGSLNRGWKIPTPTVDALMNLPIIHKVLNKKLLNYKESYYNKDLVTVEVVSGSFFIIKLSALESVDYFDENVFLYYEENILASKLKKLNLKTYICTNTSVIHNHSVTINKSIKRLNKFKILKKSQFYFEYNYNKPNILEKIILKTTYYISLLVQELIYVIESK